MPHGNWAAITPASSPPARKFAGMAYDRLNSKTLLFGGNDGVTPRLNDTWHYDPTGNLWTALSPAASPAARYGHACCDTHLGVHIFGGYDGTVLNELWVYDTNNWVQRTPGGGAAPTARQFAAMAEAPSSYPTTVECLIWGGTSGGQPDTTIWLYNHSSSTWYGNDSYLLPTPRTQHTMYYDSDRDVVIMFGGVSLLDGEVLYDLWETDGLQWMPLTTLEQPDARRVWQGMAYDGNQKRAVLAPSGAVAQGSITPYAGNQHTTGDQFVINDGVNAAKIFEIVPILAPTDIILLGGAPPTSLRFDLSSLFATPADPTGAIDHSGTSIYIKCELTGNTALVTSTYSGSVNYADSTDLMGQAAPPSTQPDEYRAGLGYTAPHVPIEADIDASAEDMRDVITYEINAAATLDITAVAAESALISLYNDRPGTSGNTTSFYTVTVPGFSVTDMAGAATDNWSYNRSGGLWSSYPEGDTAPLLEGASLVYDKAAGKFVLFGGALNGAVQSAQYEWQWSPDSLSPFYSLPGSLQGRVEPVMAQATDGSWVYVLGADTQELPDFMLNIGDSITLQIEMAISGQKLLRFDWRMRYSGKTPTYEKVVDGAAAPIDVDFRTSGLLLPVAGTDSVLGIRLEEARFKQVHEDQLCRISGSVNPANDGIYRISSVPSDIGEVGKWGAGGGPSALQAGMVAVLENAGLVHSLADPAVTVEVLGAQWRAQMYMNDGSTDILAAELVERRVQSDPDGWQRAHIAAHVSKMVTPATTLTFVLRLESTDEP